MHTKLGIIWFRGALIRYLSSDVFGLFSDGYSALHLAAWNNGPEMIRLLLALDAEFLAKTDAGLAPMLFAAEEGKLDAFKTLRKLDHYGVPHGTGGDYGPLHLAAKYGYTKVLDVMLREGRFNVNSHECRECMKIKSYLL